MFNSAQESPGEWFDCLNVGDDYEEKEDRRDDADLVIPGHSVVEVLGLRKINDDYFVHEVRLNRPRANTTETADQDFIPSSGNQMFTGPTDILKDHAGKIKFAPAMCRFKGDNVDDANAKINGRYKAPKRKRGGKYTDEEYDEFEQQEKLFGQGVVTNLLGSPTGELQFPKDITNSDQFSLIGWNVSGVYKYNTGKKTKGKKDDEDQTKNLLAYIAPAAQSAQPSIVFLTKEDITNEIFATGSVSVDLLEYVDPRSSVWNHKFLLDFAGAFGHEYEFELIVNGQGTVGPFEIQSDGTDIQAALESLSAVGPGNVTVHTPGTRTGRFIIEFVGDLAGVRMPNLKWQRIINVDPDPPENLTGGTPLVPSIDQINLPEYDYKILPGVHQVQITPASKPLNHYQRWYGSGGYYGNGYYGGYGYGYGYYPGGNYGYYGGWGGGPLGYYGGAYWGGNGYGYNSLNNGYYGPGGYNASFYIGPYDFDEDGAASPGGGYNSQGYNENGFNKNGFDAGGFDANGLNADGESWGYYGVWGHLHQSTVHDHKNDHGIVNHAANNTYQHTAAGSFGVANWTQGGAYVVVELEQREFWMHVAEEAPVQDTTYS